jgi:hypothetical protein
VKSKWVNSKKFFFNTTSFWDNRTIQILIRLRFHIRIDIYDRETRSHMEMGIHFWYMKGILFVHWNWAGDIRFTTLASLPALINAASCAVLKHAISLNILILDLFLFRSDSSNTDNCRSVFSVQVGFTGNMFFVYSSHSLSFFPSFFFHVHGIDPEPLSST